MAKGERRRTLRDTDRMRTLEAQLDAVIAEGRRLRAQLEEVSPDRRAELLDLVRKQGGRSPA